jgi:hypothetical protein
VISTPSADTDSKVIHCGSGSKVLRDRITAAADVKNFATAGKIVVNSLPSEQNSDGCSASSPARFTPSHPQRVTQRAPAGSKASAQRSERTPSREDFCISSTGGAAAVERKFETSKIMKDWKEITHYAGFDWPKAITTLSLSMTVARSWSNFPSSTQKGGRFTWPPSLPYDNDRG